MKYFGYFLVFVHFFLLAWATGGVVEMTSLNFPWTSYTNTDFPNWLLPIHWGSVIITSIGFLWGYFSEWKALPNFMLAAYSMLFTICVIETFGFMTSSTRYLAMAMELVTYALILILLFKHSYFIEYFEGKRKGIGLQ